MPRIRTIKPEFPQSQSMGRVSRDARLTFILLWTLADDSGRLRGNSRMLASLLYPYDDDAPKLLPKWMGELEREKSIVRYQVDSCDYVQICNWVSHQKIDRPSPSKLPPIENAREDSTTPREDSSLDQGPRTKEGTKDQDQGKDREKDSASPFSPAFEEFWIAYPRKEGKGRAWRAWKSAVKAAGSDVMIAAAKRYGEVFASYDKQFIPQPATWINDRRWEDSEQVWIERAAGGSNGRKQKPEEKVYW